MVHDKHVRFKYNKGKTEDEILASLYDIDAYYNTECHAAPPPPEPSDEESYGGDDLEEEMGEPYNRQSGHANADINENGNVDDTGSSSSSRYYDRVRMFHELTEGQDYTLPLALCPPPPAHPSLAMDSRTPGYELLVRMGWKPGSSLGLPCSSGSTEPLPMIVKRNKAGIGATSHTRSKAKKQ